MLFVNIEPTNTEVFVNFFLFPIVLDDEAFFLSTAKKTKMKGKKVPKREQE